MDNTILDVAIGLIFAYLVLALLCSGVQEWLTQWFDRRESFLQDGIQMLLGDVPVTNAGRGRKMSLADLVLQHGVITALMKDGKFPAYIPSRAFAVAVTESIQALHSAGTSLSQSFQALASRRLPLRDAMYAAATGDVADMQKARQSIEQWFDEGMERISGWYKRRTRVYMLLIGLTFAVIFNVDTFDLSRRLYTDRALRESVVKTAQAYAANPANKPSQGVELTTQQMTTQIGEQRKQLDVFQLPVGWPSPDGMGTKDWLLKIVGWIVTGLAVSLGAPFWFDMLAKISPLRAAGPVPAKSSPPASAAPPGQATAPAQALPPARPRLAAFSQDNLSPYDIIDIQRKLKVDPTTGVLDPATLKAIGDYQVSKNYERTEKLTSDLVSELLA